RLLTSSASITISEQEATSFGADYLAAMDLPVEGLQVHFCPDATAEAKGHLGISRFGSNIVVKGTVDAGGPRAAIHIDEVKAGNLPSAVAKPLLEAYLEKRDLKTLDLPG